MGVERAGSQRLFDRARSVIPGGVNSPVRAFRGVGGTPVFFQEGRGAWLTDVDGNRYVDYVGSWGPLILGHAYPPIVEAVTDAPRSAGTSFGAPHPGEVELAELICASRARGGEGAPGLRPAPRPPLAARPPRARRHRPRRASSSSRAATTAPATRSW